MQNYPPEEWEILSHVLLTLNINWDLSVPNSTEADYAEYDEWLEIFGCWAGTVEHVLHNFNFKALTNSTHNLLFRINLSSTE